MENRMTHVEAGEFWNRNAQAWTVLTRAGYDVYRDHLNTPAFLAMLPDVHGLVGLDIGCGEGHNTRLLAARGASMSAIDIAETFITHARQHEVEQPLGISYQVASAVELPFGDGAFDFATSFMCLMDLPETKQALQEAYRVLKPGGFLQFSISHPCFATPHRKNLRDASGKTYAFEVADYFRKMDGELEVWIFNAAPKEARAGFDKFRIPRFHRPLSEWLNLLIEVGFQLEHFGEPAPSEEVMAKYPALQDAGVLAYFLHVRARKQP
jgi:SAM-dependent methyltransferase